ncbi:MAG: protein adenylyltransferase SelO family protein, partial [Desulfobacterales bacterium]|nr:protein adenylyltransferase SelO family protein [Desulfobacterales bacterium]
GKLNEISDDALMAPLESAYYLPEQLTSDKKNRTGKWLRRYIKRLSRDAIPVTTRRKNMNAVNPKYVLRNYLAQMAIDRAEKGDFSMVGELLDLLRHPYDEQSDKEKFAEKRPEWARHRPGSSMLSCSS